MNGTEPLPTSAELVSRLVAEVDDLAIVMLDVDGRLSTWNAGAQRFTSYASAEIIGRHFSVFYPPEARAAGEPEAVLATAREHGRAEEEGWRVRKDGSRFWAHSVLTALRDDRGELSGFGKVTRDLTVQHAAEQARSAAEHRFQAAFDRAPIGVTLTGLRGENRGKFLQTNLALARMMGYELGELDGQPISIVTHPEDQEPTNGALKGLSRGDTVAFEKRFLRPDGREIWTLVSSTPVAGDDGVAEYAVTHIVDISERKRFEGQLRYLADHDALTGLYNRHRFDVDLKRVVAEARRYGRRGAVLILDLDGFKFVNDRFGHPVGDELVNRVAGLLRQTVRRTDIVARLGGDEFAIILQDADRDDAVATAEKILDAIRRRGVVMQELRHARVTTSIGITTFDGETDLTGPELVVEADIAMYDAKAAGRDRQSLYSSIAREREVVSKRYSWLERLRTAIDDDCFVLHAQPIVGIHESGVGRYELLLRLLDEDGELIPPGAFLYHAERFDLMGSIDRWVIKQAVMLLHEHATAGNDICLAVNLSGRTMNDIQLANDLAALLAEYPIPDGRLVIEVTETAAIVNIDRARELAKELRKLGCRFALDDFGAGFASFYYLKHLDFDYLKIDGEFVRRLVDTPTDQLVVRAVVQIARGLGVTTIAEFVGDDATVELLHTFGVDYGQGYHLGVPGPLSERLPALGSHARGAAKIGRHDGGADAADHLDHQVPANIGRL